ncbi:MAG: hypothetical protein RQ982_02710 [Gammaproteobacteria bacterium]|nr:hypothetical protein [Gammaproteobacteria bacterium]
MAVTPPQPVDTQLFTTKTTPHEMFINTAALSKKDASGINTQVKEGFISKPVVNQLAENTQTEITAQPPENTKKVCLVKGKRNSQSMDLITVLLMLKESQR